MPRNSQLIELDMRSGIRTNDALYAIGPRLQIAQNAVWGYPYPRVVSGITGSGPWMLRQPLTFPNRAVTTYTGAKTFRDIVFGAPPTGLSVAGANASDQYALWDAQAGGAEIAFDATAPRSTVSSAAKLLGCSAYWLNPGKHPRTGADTSLAVAVFSHLSLNHVYYMLSTDTVVWSLTVDVTNCPAGASALAVHLDRLWLADALNLRVMYTDPLNLDSIRTTNVIKTNGDIPSCLIPGQLGALDASGVPHLIIGCRTSVLVLDGDPQLGGGTQADLRTLSSGTGMASPHVAAVTPYGVFFLGTDGNLWHIPLGTQEMRPVGDPIRDVLGINGDSGIIDADGTATGSLVWFDPYLYIFPGGDSSRGYLARPTRDGIAEFWGPVVPHATALSAREAVIAAPPFGSSGWAPSGKSVPSVHSIDLTASGATAKYLVFDPRTAPTGSYPNGGNVGRTPYIESGLLTVAGHQVQVMRVWIETLRMLTAITWGVTALDEHYTSAAGVRQYPVTLRPPGIADPRDVDTQLFVFRNPLPASRGVTIRVFGGAAEDLGVQRVLVELHTTPALY